MLCYTLRKAAQLQLAVDCPMRTDAVHIEKETLLEKNIDTILKNLVVDVCSAPA